MKTIKIYKDINLKYNEANGMIVFNFEGNERETKYVFEAERIINMPVWEDCELYGYFVDGYPVEFIGLTKAIRRNIKNGEPEWYIMGQYDTDYEKPKYSSNIKVFPKTKENDEMYERWGSQREIYFQERRKLNNIASSLIQEK